jgi:acyl-coenzyme A thioesterase PaaI-like protein
MTALGYDTTPDTDGWFLRARGATGHFDDAFIPVKIRVEGERVRLRIMPGAEHTNLNNVVHGGFLMALIDYSLFAGPVTMGIERVLGGATIETATQFYAPVQPGRPVDIVVEVMKVTGKLVFSRGVVEQDGTPALGFSGTIRRRNAADSLARIRDFNGMHANAASQ